MIPIVIDSISITFIKIYRISENICKIISNDEKNLPTKMSLIFQVTILFFVKNTLISINVSLAYFVTNFTDIIMLAESH